MRLSMGSPADLSTSLVHLLRPLMHLSSRLLVHLSKVALVLLSRFKNLMCLHPQPSE